jgi:hypothetical protein
MKKLSVIIVILLILTVCVPPMKVEAATCNHGLYSATVYATQLSPWTNTGSTHTKYKTEFLICSNCLALYDKISVYQVGYHHFGSWLDGGHMSGNKHQFNRYCGYCMSSESKVLSCTGNPCVLPD